MQLRVITVLLFGGAAVLEGCNGGSTGSAERKAEKVDPYPVKILRFDQDLLKANPDHPETLEKQYPYFYQSFVEDLLSLGPKDDPGVKRELKRIITGEGFKELSKDVNAAFPNLDQEEELLSQALGRYKKEYPQGSVPRFVAFTSEFGYANPSFDSVIGVGLDFYLGSDYRFYPSMNFPVYMTRKLRREYIVPNTIQALYTWQYPELVRDKRFLAQIIREGKILYYTTQLLPEMHDTLLTGWSAQQLEWCRSNEKSIWSHFIDQNMLYNTDRNTYTRYITDAPFTVAPGVPPESAPRIGAYIGWRVVQEYAKKKKQSLKEVMEEKDAQKILESSQYKP